MDVAKTILICPLNWGLGHATRMVPLIKSYLKNGDKVIIAADGNALSFLKQEFPNLLFESFKGVSVRYYKYPFFLIGLLFQMPMFGMQIVYEYFRTKQLFHKYKPDLIISDNRYGARSSCCESVVVTHQVFLQLPKLIKWLEPILHPFTKFLINRFDTCWIPDFEIESESLSGRLSHGKLLPQNVKYIGPLTRFNFSESECGEEKFDLDVLVIVSGPEPHRSLYESSVVKMFSGTHKNVLIVQGQPDRNVDANSLMSSINKGGVIKVAHLPSELLCHCIVNAKQIHARIGYSSLMDLYQFPEKMYWSPTPGQTEQEYLYRWINREKAEKHT